MGQLTVYLTFNGNCREAIMFYQGCLGGELTIQTIGDSPMAEKMPEEMKQYVLHATLVKDGFLLTASDIVGERGLVKGNSVSLLLTCYSEEDIKNTYSNLSAGGKATHPLELTFWGALFGGLTDKFGNHWLLNYDKKGQ